MLAGASYFIGVGSMPRSRAAYVLGGGLIELSWSHRQRLILTIPGKETLLDAWKVILNYLSLLRSVIGSLEKSFL